MTKASPYPHGADLSVYPTVDVMRDVYLSGFYRAYPHERFCRIGPLPSMPADISEIGRAVYSQARPTCHAVIVMRRKVVLVRFTRRARLADIERLEYERELVGQTPELAPMWRWPVEMRLVHCDVTDGVEAEARARGIVLKVYRPKWLMTHRPKGVRDPKLGILGRKLNQRWLEQYARTLAV